MRGDPVTRFPSLTVTRFPVHVGGPHYKVPIIDSYKGPSTWGRTPLQGSCHWQLWKNHIVHVWEPCYNVPITDSYKVPSTWGGTPLQGSHHWQLWKSHIVYVGAACYKVPIIDSYKVPSTCGRDPITMFLSLTVMKKSHFTCRGDPVTRFPSLTVTSFPVHVGGTPYMVPIIDSYKVPAFTSYYTCGGTPLQGSYIPYKVWRGQKESLTATWFPQWHVLAPEDWQL